MLVPYLCSALLTQQDFGSRRLRVGLCEWSPAVPPVKAEQLQLLQQGLATARAELRVMLGVHRESRAVRTAGREEGEQQERSSPASTKVTESWNHIVGKDL